MDKVNMCQIQKQIDNSKEEMMGVISFILAIFPLSFVINSYLVAMKNIGENQGTENIRTIFFYVLIFLIIGLMFIIMYILTSAIKIKAHRYSLLFILGIKKKDFWKILYKDYCITLLLIGVKSTIVVNLISCGDFYAKIKLSNSKCSWRFNERMHICTDRYSTT